MGQGVEDVYHLKGGILKYLEEVPAEDSAWQGECFVFDRRVSVGHGLTEGPHILCHACRRPILPEDRARPEYEEGVVLPPVHRTRRPRPTRPGSANGKSRSPWPRRVARST